MTMLWLIVVSSVAGVAGAQPTPPEKVAVTALAVQAAVGADTSRDLLLVTDTTSNDVDMAAVARQVGRKARHVGKTANPKENERGVRAIIAKHGASVSEIRVTIWGVTKARSGQPGLPFGTEYLVTLAKTGDGKWRVVRVVEQWTS